MNKKDVKEIKDLEQYYSKVRKIKFSEEIEEKYKNLSLFKIFYLLTMEKEETYFVRGKLQCKKFKMRSLDDLFAICKYYFPKKTIKQVLSSFIKMSSHFSRKDTLVPILLYCPDIRKINFRGPGFYAENYFNKNLRTQNNFENIADGSKVIDIIR